MYLLVKSLILSVQGALRMIWQNLDQLYVREYGSCHLDNAVRLDGTSVREALVYVDHETTEDGRVTKGRGAPRPPAVMIMRNRTGRSKRWISSRYHVFINSHGNHGERFLSN